MYPYSFAPFEEPEATKHATCVQELVVSVFLSAAFVQSALVCFVCQREPTTVTSWMAKRFAVFSSSMLLGVTLVILASQQLSMGLDLKLSPRVLAQASVVGAG